MIAKRTSGGTERRYRLKRVYDAVEEDDGYRVLVDRLWPRGISKEKARIDLWLKDIAPSDALRRLVHGDPGKWDIFVAAYRLELETEPAKSAAELLRERLGRGAVTLVYAARNEDRNNAVALKSWLER